MTTNAVAGVNGAWQDHDQLSQPTPTVLYGRVQLPNGTFTWAPINAQINANGLATLVSNNTALVPCGSDSPTAVTIQGSPEGTPVWVTLTNPQTSVNVSNFPSSYPVTGSVAITGTPTVNIASFPSSQTVSGTVNIGNYPQTQQISGTVTVSNFPTQGGTQTVSGTVNVGNFPAFPTNQVVSFASAQNVNATITGTPTVNVGNYPATQAVTGTFWQATQPVSGTFWQAVQPVSISALPSISGAVSITNLPATQTVAFASTPTFNIGTMPSITGAVSITGTPSVTATISGTPSVNATITNTPSVNATITGTPTVNATVTNFPAQATVQGTDYASATSGTMFMAGSGVQTIALASNFRMTLTNTSATKSILLREMDLFSTVAVGSVHVYFNPSLNLPATARPVTNTNIGGSSNPASIAVVKADTSSTAIQAGTGIDTGLDYGGGANFFETINFPPLVLRPGQSLGLNAYAVAAVSLTVLLRWSELVI